MARYIEVAASSSLLGVVGEPRTLYLVVDTQGPLYTVGDSGATARGGLVRALGDGQALARDVVARLNATEEPA
jgi:hypothetical protein